MFASNISFKHCYVSTRSFNPNYHVIEKSNDRCNMTNNLYSSYNKRSALHNVFVFHLNI